MRPFILIIFLIVGLITKAQQTELIENTWYLEKLVLNGEEFLAPNNEEVSETIFLCQECESETNVVFFTSVCTEVLLNGSINNNILTLQSGFVDGECSLAENINFEGYYLDNFFNVGIFDEFYDYEYEINSIDNGLQLTLTNVDGNKAYYKNHHLSIQEFNVVNKNLLTTIQDDWLYVKIINSTFNPKTISIYDLKGRLILRSKIINEKVFVGQVPNSIYIVQIEDINGNFYNKKVIKK